MYIFFSGTWSKRVEKKNNFNLVCQVGVHHCSEITFPRPTWLSNQKSSSKNLRVLHKCHLRGLFPTLLRPTNSWYKKPDRTVWPELSFSWDGALWSCLPVRAEIAYMTLDNGNVPSAQKYHHNHRWRLSWERTKSRGSCSSSPFRHLPRLWAWGGVGVCNARLPVKCGNEVSLKWFTLESWNERLIVLLGKRRKLPRKLRATFFKSYLPKPRGCATSRTWKWN